jgi:DNA-directed RNA polymerase specialized sigma24 family protein
MAKEGSVTKWLAQVKEGDRDAIQHLWERYFEKLVALARSNMRAAPRRIADEEDVAVSAMDSFFRAAANKRFPRLEDRDDLWVLLVTITLRKASKLVHFERRHKRGGGAPEADMAGAVGRSGELPALEEIIDTEPTPELAAQAAEEYERLLGKLGDDTLRRVAILKMEGDSLEEIAQRIGYGLRSVHRKLDRIRALWAREVAP